LTPDWPAGVGLVGAGAMGRALVAGLVRGRPALAGRIVVADVVPAAAEAGAAECGGRVGSPAEAAACELVCVAVKPGDVAPLIDSVRGALAPGGVLLSVAAGVTLDHLAGAAPGHALVRCMPNLAVRHGAGIVAVATRGVEGPRHEALRALLGPLGAVVDVPEANFAAATALAGSGPGLVALIAEALEDGAVASGLTRAQARAMAQGVLAGTAALLADGLDPAVLRQQVSSPGGTTIAGLLALERGAVRAHVAEAVRVAAARAAEMAGG
jgi:pyrroline-5-carboxylate reductase